MVEFHPSKVEARIRFPLNADKFHKTKTIQTSVLMNTDARILEKAPQLPVPQPIFQPRHSRILFAASWLFLLSGLYAAYQGHYDLAICPAGIFVTSINYWRHPIYGWRRNLDILIVKLATFYQLTRALTAQHGLIFYTGYAIAFTCYPISNHYLAQGRHLESVTLHALLHIFSNISCIILFSGSIEDTLEVARLYLNSSSNVN